MLIENHPKMVGRWADRCLEITDQDGPEVARIWAHRFFSQEQIRKINEEFKLRKVKKNEGST